MMKNKTMIRRLALLLCLSLVIGIIPIGMLSMPVSGAVVPTDIDSTGPAATELVLNGGFESGTANWKWGAGYGYLTASDDAHSGEASIKHKPDSTSGRSTTQDVTVEAGKTYIFSAWVKVLSGTGGYLWVYDENVTLYHNKFATADECNGNWVQLTSQFTPADGITKVKIEFGTHSNQTAEYLIDDISIVEVVEQETPVTNLLVNGDFEAGVESWKANGNFTAFTDDKHGGEGAAQYVDSSSEAAGYTNQKVAVEAGKTYTLSAWVKVVSGTGGYIGIYGISNAVAVGFTAEEGWKQYTTTVTIPEGATLAEIEIGAHKSQVVTFLIDDVVFAEFVENTPDPTETTAATEPSTEPAANGLPVNGDFENGVANWSGSTGAISSNTGEKHGGSASMQFVDASPTAAPYVYQKVAVEAGKTYKLSAWAKVLEGSGGYIGVFSANNEVADLKGFSNTAEWTQFSMEFTVPAGVTQVKAEIGASTANIVTFLIDDVVLEEVTSQPDPTDSTENTEASEETQPSTENTEASEETQPSTEPATEPDPNELIVNGGFENDVANWSANSAASAYAVDKHHGNAAMQFVDDSDSKAPYIKQKVTVEGGKTYKLTAWTKIISGAGGYLAAFGTDIAILEILDPSTEWVKKTITIVVPEGVTEIEIEIGSTKTGVVTFLMDDVSLKEVVEEPEKPFDPMKPLEEKFEKPIYENNLSAGPAGWTSNDDVNDVYAPMIALRNDVLSHDGNYLALTMPGKWKIQSPAFPVEIGYKYTAAYLARKLVDNGVVAGEVQICFVNARGKLIDVQSAAAGKTYGTWTEESLAAVAPDGAAKAYVVFTLEYNDGRKEADYAIDDLVVTRAQEPDFVYDAATSTEPAEFVSIYKDSFDNYYNPEGAAASVKVPNNWTVSQESAAIGSAKYDSYDGTMNLIVQGKGNMWARSPMIDVKSGYVYYATFVERKLQFYLPGTGGYATVVFVDQNGDMIKEYKQTIGTSDVWTYMEVGGLAPAGAMKMYVEFGMASATGTPAYCVDNLEILEGKANVVAPSTPDYNPPTGDNVVLLAMPAVLLTVLALAVLVINKRKFF